MDSERVQNLLITIDDKNIVNGAKEILTIIRSGWNLNNVKFKFFTDGITNKLVGCFHNESQTQKSDATAKATNNSNHSTMMNGSSPHRYNSSDVVLIRVYGKKTELMFDRKTEQRNLKILNGYGFGPRLYATFHNGIAYEYVPGCTLDTDTVIMPKIWHLVAKRMAEMHKIDTPIDNCCKKSDTNTILWTKTQTLLNLIPQQFSDKTKNERASKIFPSVDELRKEFLSLFSILKQSDSPIVVAHNDLLLGNIIYNGDSNDITFIDYEYFGLNYQAFDIGNHFAEFAGLKIEDIDYNRYPTKEFQMEWLKVYLKHFLSLNDEIEVENSQIEKLYVQANQFSLASHLFWAVWGLVQAENSTIDFDFIQYSKIRYDEYLNKKDQFLSLQIAK